MKKMFFITIFVIIGFIIFSCKNKADYAKQVEKIVKKDRMVQSKETAKEFMTYLKGELTNAIKKSGPQGAIEVCKTLSPETEKKFKEKDLEIISFRRVSLKPRNVEKHTPTQAEQEWLTKTETDMKKNIKPEPGLIESTDKTTVLLPIVIKDKKCLMCHGDPTNFGDELKAILKKNYPKDQAVNYKMNDLRGALVIEWKK
ncbi:MAG: DUF3365 domain-containing protein [Spirochaetota bacterium]|nr:DUF3365 domain-containing protein [Spirochaetota bacterium]